MKVAAADLGATSGRVVVADLTSSGPALTEVARFRNGAVQADGLWTWPIRELYDHVVNGVAQARELGASSWGIDTWGVDYGVVRLDEPLGALAGPVVSHRDARHVGGVHIVRERIPWAEHYAISGIQHMDFNTAYQLAADDSGRLVEGATLLLVPDLLGYWATGVASCEVTDASTTGMVDPRTRQWSPELIDALGLPPSAFLELREPGAVVSESIEARVGGLPLVRVASHDTASAFLGAPVEDRDLALILSLGTWALIGAEVVGAEPDDHRRSLNLTHELGADGTVRLLRNVAGMWLLEECRRTWAREDGAEPDLPSLLAAADAAAPFTAVFDVDARPLEHPGQSPATIAPHLVTTMAPDAWAIDRGAVVRAILESLVIRLVRRASEIEGVLGLPRPTLHVVGGATRIPMLMQWLADATGKTVVAGPVEATAIGNALVQWQALGVIASVGEGRSIVSSMQEIRTYLPTGSSAAWQAAAQRLEDR